MPLDSSGPQLPIAASRNLPEAVYRSYTALTSTQPLDAEKGLAGKLLYAGEIGGEGRHLLFAANIAGAASLAASADATTQRQALRDGVVDFLVTSLGEAVRILKNEIRKRQTVSVGVAVAPHVLVEQMLDRGVLPDLLPPVARDNQRIAPEQIAQFIRQGAVPVIAGEDRKAGDGSYVTWSVGHDFARWLPRLDSVVEESLPSDDWVRQRWLRLAPRYLGRVAQREHGVALSGDEMIRLRSLVLELLAEYSQDAGKLPLVRIDGVPVG
jgi:hypothetical protein